MELHGKKGELDVRQLPKRTKERFPFCVNGFHVDKGGAFINIQPYSCYAKRQEPVHKTRRQD